MGILIGICDDEIEICKQLEKVLASVFRKKQMEVQIDCFNNGEQLCSEMQNKDFDLVFLDIELPDMNGMEIGCCIREEMKNDFVQIAYISSKESYAMQLFEYRPINFLVKPLRENAVEKLINKFLRITNQDTALFSFKKGYQFYKVPLFDILYFCNSGRKVTIVTKDGTNEFYDSMENVYARVKGNKFLFIHKSVIVNYNHIAKFGYEQVEMINGASFSISQSRRKEIRTMYLDIKKEELG